MSDESPITAAAFATKKHSAVEMSKALFDAGLGQSGRGSGASWLLIGIGAAITLSIGNVESTVAFVGAVTFNLILLSLLIGALLGIAEKGLATMVQAQAHIFERLEKALPEINDSHNQRMQSVREVAATSGEAVDTDIDFATPIKELESIGPWHNKAKFRKRLQEGFDDPLSGREYAARLYNRQIAYAIG